MKIVLDKEYEVKCTLGTIKDIENGFSKSFYEVLAEVNKMKLEEQIKLIYIGAKRATPDLLYKDFEAKLEENIGLDELTEFLEKYLLQLQYPGKTEEEIRTSIEKKVAKGTSPKEFDFGEIITNGAVLGLKPNEIWELELWEYNAYMKGYSIRQKQEISNCILTGYYSAYYINGGKKAKSPNEIVASIYKESAKQNINEGLKQIERIKKLKGEL